MQGVIVVILHEGEEAGGRLVVRDDVSEHAVRGTAARI